MDIEIATTLMGQAVALKMLADTCTNNECNTCIFSDKGKCILSQKSPDKWYLKSAIIEKYVQANVNSSDSENKIS